MTAYKLFQTARAFAKHLAALHRRRTNSSDRRVINRFRRPSLSSRARADVLTKTAGRCHICGGLIQAAERWCADHVLAYAHGGPGDPDNYLPAHGLCNTYRWHFDPEELQWILKLGVWLRSQIEREDELALMLAERFIRHEVRRDRRRVQ